MRFFAASILYAIFIVGIGEYGVLHFNSELKFFPFLLNVTIFASGGFLVFGLTRLRYFSFLMVSLVYCTLWILHIVKFHFWGLPLLVTDVFALREFGHLLPRMLGWGWLTLGGLGITLALLAAIRLEKPGATSNLVRIALVIFPGLLLSSFWFRSAAWERHLSEMGLDRHPVVPLRSLLENGSLLTYSLNLRTLDVGVPTNYSRVSIQRIVERLPPTQTSPASDPVNLILYVMESFTDPKIFSAEFAEDPIPFFRRLSKTHLSGKLAVPVFGGATCNSEFEILTGMPVGLFPNPGALPFSQYITRRLSALPAQLRDAGYRTIAIHPNEPHFWSRNLVYPLLGFESFVDVSAFSGSSWGTSDTEVVDQIIQASQTPSPVFVYGLTISTHLPFTPNRIANFSRRFLKNHLTAENEPLEVYSQLIHQSDQALQKLVEHFSQRKEKTVIVALGDHLPALPTSLWNALTPTERYQTPLLIWANFALPRKAFAPVRAYQLGSRILDWVGVAPSPLFRASSALAEKKLAPAEFWQLQYDQLFGKKHLDALAAGTPERLVAHAGGAFAGQTYTNSREAIESSYRQGARWIELDFSETSDGEWVLLHDWNENFVDKFARKPGRVSEREFARLKMRNGLTPVTRPILKQLLTKYPDLRVVTDVKEQNPAFLKWLRSRFGDLASRFVVQIYSFDEYRIAQALGFRKIILTLYRSAATDAEVLAFAQSHALVAVTLWADRVLNSEMAKALSAQGIRVYAHTVNRRADFERLREQGAFGIYTDHLWESPATL